ncbi:PSD1 and planctomycete cytochrome C domain-containing protein [Prosthecobacter sp.]|uniref:PSD1 and planctomycete cytochrome C domain-containing protein n=1 Tax=Prosthecobacter sp. TaxID=1965333 RepID=UPI002488FF15|nr:PSD1 and planctomycete cytochrome C domain-containing protein [Prosthecobacter sp.]MDI1314543.1 PSD1 and planctomycete cytochrome C domain-containing protein [Prosthecobacter sp.]
MNPLRFSPLLFSIAATATTALALDDTQRAAATFFENEVRPVLVKRCYECHSDTKQKGGLRVDHIGYLKTGGDTGPALVPGKPEASALIEAVHYANADFQMPPKQKLPDAEIAILEKWIKLGAPWPEDASKQVVVTEGGFTEQQRNYWFFQPVAKVSPPQVDGKWGRNEIDRFIEQKRAALRLTPASEADRHELVRRVYFDLHGLPPTQDQINTFVNDKEPLAYEKLVDELLASPRYGERWAQHWLDLVRYAESDGYNQDAYRSFVWPYRDYVIKSFNDDKPYDQFVREQLAGDEIAPNDPEVMIATAFLRHPVYEYNLRDVRGQWDLILTDLTDTAGELFLGLSMGCARCHNHKFDPILQKDYYRLRAFFTPVHWRDDLKLVTPAEKQAFDEQQAKWEAATAAIRAKMDALTKPGIDRVVETWLVSFTEDLQAMTFKPADQRDALEKQLGGLCERQLDFARASFDPTKNLKTDAAKAEYKALKEELNQFQHLKPKPLPEAYVATDAGPAAPANLLSTRKGDQEIAPGFLAIVDPNPPKITPTKTSTGRRTALADWITRPDNQLSTRVIVNRVWQYHFGRGMVASASEFGTLGEKPSHPALLDFLTAKFVAGGWHLKALHREIMLSATYRQTARREPDATAAKVDPSNVYLWRFNPRRLDAEQVRDAMLAVSGELDLTAGGPSGDGNGTRRSVYTRKKRNSPNDLLLALDMPAGFTSTAERQSTTTPTQALQLLNGDWLLARARKLASQVKGIDEVWMAVLGRRPTDKERATADAFLKRRIGMTEAALPATEAAENNAPSRGFHFNSPHERLLVRSNEKEGDEFSVEAIVKLDSVDVNAELRTLVSHWDGGKASLESFGWSIDVTGQKSRYKPRNILMQLVGEDENANIGYQVVASDIHIEVGRRYHLVVRVSSARHSVTFTVRDLDTPGAAVQSAVVPMDRLSNLSRGASPVILGGLNKRTPTRQWDGQIEALRLVAGHADDSALNTDAEKWNAGLFIWRAADPPNSQFTWSGADTGAPQENDPLLKAMTGLCQVLLTSNQFFYLH